jgi:hypothetical protein
MSKFEFNPFAMTLIIDKNNVNDLPKLLASRLKRKSKKSSLSKQFEKLKRELDGFACQITLPQKHEIQLPGAIITTNAFACFL